MSTIIQPWTRNVVSNILSATFTFLAQGCACVLTWPNQCEIDFSSSPFQWQLVCSIENCQTRYNNDKLSLVLFEVTPINRYIPPCPFIAAKY